MVLMDSTLAPLLNTTAATRFSSPTPKLHVIASPLSDSPHLSRSPKLLMKTTSVRQLTIFCPSCKTNLHPLHFRHSPTVHQCRTHSSKLLSSSNEPQHLFRHPRMPLLHFFRRLTTPLLPLLHLDHHERLTPAGTNFQVFSPPATVPTPTLPRVQTPRVSIPRVQTPRVSIPRAPTPRVLAKDFQAIDPSGTPSSTHLSPPLSSLTSAPEYPAKGALGMTEPRKTT